jgi:hypothetical protein
VTVDWNTWQEAKRCEANAHRLGLDTIDALDQNGLLLSKRKSNQLHREFIDRMLTLLRGDMSPYQLQQLNGTETNISATGTYEGFISWLAAMGEEFDE